MNNMILKGKKTIIGMIHLPPLVTYPDSPGMGRLIKSALEDLYALESGGIDAAIVENQNDALNAIFLNKRNLESFISVAKNVVKKARIPIGISALRNDWKAAFSIAKSSGAEFIRLDVFVDKVLMEDKMVSVNPKKLQAYRKRISAEKIFLLADVQVKHAKMLEKKALSESVKQALSNGADAVVVTGPFTGIAPTVNRVKEVKRAAGNTPVFVGSGVTSQNVKMLLKFADGAIVGTSLKVNGKVDALRVEKLMKSIKGLRSGKGDISQTCV